MMGASVRVTNGAGYRSAIPVRIAFTREIDDISYWNLLDSGFASERHGFGLSGQHEIEGPGTLRITTVHTDPAAALLTYISYRRVD